MSKACLSSILLVAAGVVILQGCRATPVQNPAFPLARVETPSVFLVSPKEKDAVRLSLVTAGFIVEESHLATPYFLRVTIGSPQGVRSCGEKHNVRYELAIEGALAIDLRRKGYTGTCEPSVLDVLSRQLYEHLALPADLKGKNP
jgi:hypothetical protein